MTGSDLYKKEKIKQRERKRFVTQTGKNQNKNLIFIGLTLKKRECVVTDHMGGGVHTISKTRNNYRVFKRVEDVKKETRAKSTRCIYFRLEKLHFFFQ